MESDLATLAGVHERAARFGSSYLQLMGLRFGLRPESLVPAFTVDAVIVLVLSAGKLFDSHSDRVANKSRVRETLSDPVCC